MIRRESNSFRFCAKNINNNNYIIADAIRFEGSEENIIYAICYDDINNNIVKIPVYKTSSLEKLETILYDIVSCYRNDHNGVYWFC